MLGRDFFSLHNVDRHRTNNFAEAYHSTLHDHYEKKSKPKIGEWLVVTREVSSSMELRADSIRSGRRPAPIRSDYSIQRDREFAEANVQFEAAWNSGRDQTTLLRLLRQFAYSGGLTVEEIEEENIESEEEESESETDESSESEKYEPGESDATDSDSDGNA